MANPAKARKPPRTLAEELGGGVPADPSSFIKQALEATAEKQPASQPTKPASKATGAAAPVATSGAASRVVTAAPIGQPMLRQAPTTPAPAAPASRPIAAQAAARPWGAPAPAAQYRPGRRPPGDMSFTFHGRVEDGKRLDNGKYLLRCAGDGWYSIYAEILPDWLEVGMWIETTGIIAAGQGGTLFLWAREFSAIDPIQE